ncbi:MAG: hypothetical protein JWP84_4500, partial [Tardiphaga sp.]|nr:hypothetical protein [Tardiphaga sp.]
TISPHPQRDQPSPVHGNEPRIVTGPNFQAAPVEKPFRILVSKDEFAATLQRYKAEENCGEGHAARRIATQLAVKPGPSDVSNDRNGTWPARTRSSTNKTVGADIFP